MKNVFPSVAALCLAIIFAVACPAFDALAADPVADCNIDLGLCIKKTAFGEVVLDITPKPVPYMKELTFTVRLKGQTASRDSLTIDLGMPGMYMGRNVVTLKKTSPDTFAGKGVIPRCPSGRTLWRASVVLSENEKTDFLFDVRP